MKATIAARDQDAHSSMQRLKAAEERVKELHALLLQKTHDLDVAQDVARKLRREYQSTRQDAEGMLQVLNIVTIYSLGDDGVQSCSRVVNYFISIIV